MPCHHKLEEYLDAYIKVAGLSQDRKGPLFRSAIGKTAQLSVKPMLHDRRNDDFSVGEVERMGI